MRKTQILNQNNAQNDPIDHRIKGSLFRDFEDKFWHSRNDFSRFSPQNLAFKHSLDTNITIEDEES